MNVFSWNNLDKEIEINDAEVLLVREFADLSRRDKTKRKTKFMRELTYIFLAIDWRSPYSAYSAQERHNEALLDASLTQEEFDDPLFRAACRKYQELQNSNKSIQLLNAAKSAADKLIDYFDSQLDFNERTETGTLIYKPKDVISEMKSIQDVHKALKDAEEMVKQDLFEQSSLRGGQVDGFHADV